MSDLKKFWQEQMKDPAFAAYVDKMQARREVADAIFKARVDQDLSQKELATLCGLSQRHIRRLENEDADATVKDLDKIARALGCRVQIRFVPDDGQRN